MSIVKSFSVNNGDMFYIKHGSDNFTVIDCYLSGAVDKDQILNEIEQQKKNKGVSRFISTHPDEDHIGGLNEYDDKFGIDNFYCVKNETNKSNESESFKRYKSLRNSDKSYHVYKNCVRKWMNQTDSTRGSAGINYWWPDTENEHYKSALEDVKNKCSPNNISTICTYSLNEGPTFLWMGDLETDFMKNIEDDVDITECDILFAPHHGRKSGRVPKSWLNKINPLLIIVGQAPSSHLEYYDGYNTLTQNRRGHIEFYCRSGYVDIYVEKPPTITPSFLSKSSDKGQISGYNNEEYIGSLSLKRT